jgi:hypothetical protein
VDPDGGAERDTESEAVADEVSSAGSSEPAEEAAMHYTDGD